MNNKKKNACNDYELSFQPPLSRQVLFNIYFQQFGNENKGSFCFMALWGN